MNSWRESMSNVTFGLTLVLIMSTALFALVGLNPKAEDYGYLPWLYAGLSAVGAAVLWRISGRLSQPTQPTQPTNTSL